MKSFREFIAEKTSRRDYSKKGGQGGTRSTSSTPFQRGEDRARLQDTSKYQTPGRSQRPKPLTADDIYQAARPVDASVDIGKGQSWIGSSKRVIKQAKSADAAERAAKGFGNMSTSPETGSGGRTASSSKPRGTTAKPGDLESFMRGEQGKGRSVSGTLQDVAGRKGAGYDFPKDAGTEKPKPTKPGSYVVDTDPKKGKPTGSLSKGNLRFSGDAKYKEMLAKLPDAKPRKPRTTTVKQAEVSKDIAQKTADYKTQRGETAYRKTSADIEARRAFPTGKGGLKADETNPYVKREVRQARAAKLGGNVWDQPKGSNRPFKDVLKNRALQQMGVRRAKIDIATGKTSPKLPNLDWKSTAKPKPSKPSGAPDRSSVRQAIKDLRASKSTPATPPKSSPSASKSYAEIPKVNQVPKSERPSQRPVNAITHGVDAKGNYLSKAERKRIHSGKPGAVVKYEPPKAEVAPKPEAKPKPLTAKSVGKEVSKSISKTQARGRVGAGGVLSALGAAQEYKVGAARAKAEGKGKLGQLFRGAMRAGGAFLGGTGGTALGGAVTKSGIGAAAAGAYGYSKGAEAGSSLAKKVEKSKAGQWLASKAKQYLPGLK